MPLPPTKIRQGGGPLRFDDEYFVDSALEDLDYLESVGLGPDSTFLDLGCGPGRLAIGLIQKDWAGSYLGVEVNKRHVEWTQREITPAFPTYEFVRVDAQNERYNPDGTAARKLPVEDASLDFICAFSVFSHLLTEESQAYLAEFRRTLKPTGRADITAYVAHDVPDETENPEGNREWKGRLHCVQYSVPYFEPPDRRSRSHGARDEHPPGPKADRVAAPAVLTAGFARVTRPSDRRRSRRAHSTSPVGGATAPAAARSRAARIAGIAVGMRAGRGRRRPVVPTIERTIWWQNALPRDLESQQRRSSIRVQRRLVDDPHQARLRCVVRRPSARRQNDEKSCSPSSVGSRRLHRLEIERSGDVPARVREQRVRGRIVPDVVAVLPRRRREAGVEVGVAHSADRGPRCRGHTAC